MEWTNLLQRAPARLLASGLLVAMLTVAGCGTSPVCSDLDSLKSSVSALKDVKLEQGSLSTLQDKLKAVQKDFKTLASDAKSQFSSEISAVKSAAAAFKSSLDAAIANPTAGTLAAVGTAFQPLKTALSNLESAVQKTC